MKKHPLQNRTNVQIKGGGGQRPFEQCSKKLHFFERGASLVETFKMATMVNRRALFLANWVQFWKLGLISGKIEISEKTAKKTSSTNL